MEQISFEELRKIHLQEKHSSSLSFLAEEFYDIYLKYLDDFYSQLRGSFSIEGAKTFENSKTVFMELVRLRCQKIILKAFKDNGRSHLVNSDGLTHQERALYLSMLRSFTDYEALLSTKVSRKKAEPILSIEILQDVPEFVSPSGKSVGPFTIGAKIELDEQTANLLIEKQLGKLA